jgi:flagellar protein FliO/FliZ
MLLLSTSSRADSVVQLFTTLLVFIFVLVLAYYVTKFTAGIQKGRLAGSNVEILETFKISQNKYIQVARIGSKYFSYVVCKDTVTLLGELTEDEVSEFNKAEANPTVNVNFKEIFDKIKKK